MVRQDEAAGSPCWSGALAAAAAVARRPAGPVDGGAEAAARRGGHHRRRAGPSRCGCAPTPSPPTWSRSSTRSASSAAPASRPVPRRPTSVRSTRSWCSPGTRRSRRTTSTRRPSAVPRVYRPAKQPDARKTSAGWFLGRLSMSETLRTAGVPLERQFDTVSGGVGGGERVIPEDSLNPGQGHRRGARRVAAPAAAQRGRDAGHHLRPGRDRAADPPPHPLTAQTSSTTLPRTCPASTRRCASAACASGNVRSTSTVSRPASTSPARR